MAKEAESWSNKKLALAGVVILVFVVAIVAISGPEVFAPAGQYTYPISYKCSVDKLSDYYTAGSVDATYGTRMITYEDTCYSSSALREYTCANTRVGYENYKCPSRTCSNGVCTGWDVSGSNAYTMGNVGIGTMVPLAKLDVAGDVKADQFCLGKSCISSWPSGTGGGGGVAEGLWGISGDDIYTMNNVGIGTTNPLEKLDVNGNIRTTGLLHLDAPNGVGQIISSGDLQVISSIMTLGADLVTIGKSNPMTIMPEGNVGIGTTSPSEKLEVKGGVKADYLLVRDPSGGVSSLSPPCQGSWQQTAPVDGKTAYVWVCS